MLVCAGSVVIIDNQNSYSGVARERASVAPNLQPSAAMRRAEPTAAASSAAAADHAVQPDADWLRFQARRMQMHSETDGVEYDSVASELKGLKLCSSRPVGFVPERYMRNIRGRPVVVLGESKTRATTFPIRQWLREPNEAQSRTPSYIPVPLRCPVLFNTILAVQHTAVDLYRLSLESCFAGLKRAVLQQCLDLFWVRGSLQHQCLFCSTGFIVGARGATQGLI